MQVRVIYDQILRQTAKPVEVFDESLKKLADQMTETMKSHQGIGLAANQVGIDKRLIVLGYQPTEEEDDLPSLPFLQLCNPRVVRFSKEKDVMTEGCLSLPMLELPVKRSSGVVVEAQDITGKPVTIKAKGLLARVLQHEIDHLNGILFTDHVDNYRRVKDYGWAKIVFIGSDDFSRETLAGLHKSGLNVVAAISETDKRAGRGQQIREPEIKSYAQELGIALFQPEDTEQLTQIVKQLEPDLIVLSSYGKILPAEALEIPVFGALNVHPSLLPKYRGATPIQSVILNGESVTGVTIIEMLPKVDAGRIVLQEKLEIMPEETSVELRSRLASKGAELLVRAIVEYLSGQAKLIEQDASQVTMTKRLKREDGLIDWDKSAEEILNQIRALQPWPGTYTQMSGKLLKIISARLKDGKLLPVTVQLEGKTAISWNDFLKGYQNQLTREPWYDKIAW